MKQAKQNNDNDQGQEERSREVRKDERISNGKARKKTCQAIRKEKEGTCPQPGF
jgi:hypothetical protein